jgi:hypothetical protein
MKSKLSSIDIIILVTSALLADVLNAIPFLNIVVAAVSTCFFQLYFFMKGVKKAKYSLVGNVAEFIPGLSVLPAVTAGVIATIIANRAEEKVARKLMQAKKVAHENETMKQLAARNARNAITAQQQNEILNLRK